MIGSRRPISAGEAIPLALGATQQRRVNQSP
jgi:hypothetical protein